MPNTVIYNQVITETTNSILVNGVTHPILSINVEPIELTTYVQDTTFFLEQIVTNPSIGSPIIADRKSVILISGSNTIKFDYNTPYNLRVQIPSKIKRATLIITELSDVTSVGGSASGNATVSGNFAPLVHNHDSLYPSINTYNTAINGINTTVSGLSTTVTTNTNSINSLNATVSGLTNSLITSLTNIASPSFAISSGDELNFGGYLKEDAFSEVYDEFWISAVQGGSIPNNAWIGQNFNTPRNIKGLAISQYGSSNNDTSRMIATADIQTSNDGSSWTTVKSIRLSFIIGFMAFYALSTTATYIRVIATSSCDFGWHVYRVQVFV